MFKYVLQSLKQTFLVFTFEKLGISCVAEGKLQVQIKSVVQCPVFVKVGFAEVHLRFTGDMFKRQTAGVVLVYFFFPYGHVACYCAVRTVKLPLIFFTEPVVNPFCGMPLLFASFFIFFKSMVYIHPERVEFWVRYF